MQRLLHLCFPCSAAERLLGDQALSMTQDPELHTHLRHTMSPYFTAEAVQRLMPNIHATVQKHMARWAATAAAAAGPIDGWAGCKALTFDIMVNQGMQIAMDDVEVEKYAKVFETWVAGFLPPAINLPIFPFGRGMAARYVQNKTKHCDLQLYSYMELSTPSAAAAQQPIDLCMLRGGPIVRLL